jgi:hypothetical protein
MAIMSRSSLVVGVLVLFGSGALPFRASAQDGPLLGAVAEASRSAETRRAPEPPVPRTLHSALREYGFDPDRLTRTERRALEAAHSELFPRSGTLARAQLNRAQSVALVYVALVEPSRDRGWPGRGRAGCGDAGERVYALASMLNDGNTGHRLFLNRDEQERARRGAREIQQAAAGCGDYRLADQAIDLLHLLNANLAERSRVAEQLSRMRRTLQDFDGRR